MKLKILFAILAIFVGNSLQNHQENHTNENVIEDFVTFPVTKMPIEPITGIFPPLKMPKNIFTVISPSNIRPGETFKISGIRFNGVAKKFGDVLVKIIGTTQNGAKYESIEKSLCLSRNHVDSVLIDTSDIPKGSYFLLVTSDDFSQSKSLNYMSKHITFIIQLNKGIFKPGDLVQFRVFSMDSETRTKNPDLHVYISISDSNGNLVMEFKNAEFIEGRFEGEMLLGDKAMTGFWMVKVSMENEFTQKEFEVAEYTLPFFLASLSMPSSLPLSYGKFPITIIAEYTFGEAVEGNAVLRIERFGEKILTKNVNLTETSTTFDFDMVKDLKAVFTENWQQILFYDVFLTVTDTLTGTKSSDEGNFQIRKFSNEFVVTGDPYIIPGEKFNFFIILKKFDGTPAEDGTEVNVIITQYLNDPNNSGVNQEIITQILHLDDNGSVESSFEVNKKANFVSIEIKAKDSTNGYLYGSLPWSDLRLDVLTENPNLYEEVKLRILTSDKSVDSIVVLISSKGILLESNLVKFESSPEPARNFQSVTFSFTPDFEYAPTTKIVVYYIKGDKLVSTSAQVSLRDKLPNSILFSFKNREVKPGCALNFNIYSAPNSTVSLQAIDQRVLLLAGLDNHKEEVFANLDGFNYENFFRGPWWGDDWIFSSAGLLYISNLPQEQFDFPLFPQPLPEGGAPGSRDKSASSTTQVRKDFRETFLWQNIMVDSILGTASVETTVPESITSYVITGVSMNSKVGFGVPEFNPNVRVFLPFFISVEFPFSVKRNEILLQDILVFNYLGISGDITVTVDKDRFESPGSAEFGWTETKSSYINVIKVNDEISNFKLQFPIKPLVLGFINFKISAVSPQAGDAIEKPLRVISEGLPRTITTSVLIVLDDSTKSVNTSLEITLPDGVIEDTIEMSATVTGDILGKALKNLDNLINMPSGCGEQILIILVPNLAIWNYLTATEQLTPKIEEKLRQYAIVGYQNELNYQRKDGSISAFGESDPSGSTWLSAYAAKAFNLASKYITIDSFVMTRILEFVAKNQVEDGRFLEPGRVIHSDMQGAAGNGVGLTAYVSIVLSEILSSYPAIEIIRNNANNFLSNSNTSDVYELALISYALKLANHSHASEFYNKFYEMRIETTTEILWKKTLDPPPNSWYGASSLDIEITSYGLLTTLLNGNNLPACIKIVKYLMSQSNSFGGYSSSQDTVMALLALSEFAKTFKSSGQVELLLKPDVGDLITTTIDPGNPILVQEFDLNKDARKLNISASTLTTGIALVSFFSNFYQDPSKTVPSFKISYKFKTACVYQISFEACTSYIPEEKSNMAIMRVTMPSGFVYMNYFPQSNPDVSKIETTNQETEVIFYFNSIGNEPSCVNINAYRAKMVRDLKGGIIEVNDYYDTTKFGTLAYEVPDLSGNCFTPIDDIKFDA